MPELGKAVGAVVKVNVLTNIVDKDDGHQALKRENNSHWLHELAREAQLPARQQRANQHAKDEIGGRCFDQMCDPHSFGHIRIRKQKLSVHHNPE